MGRREGANLWGFHSKLIRKSYKNMVGVGDVLKCF